MIYEEIGEDGLRNDERSAKCDCSMNDDEYTEDHDSKCAFRVTNNPEFLRARLAESRKELEASIIDGGKYADQRDEAVDALLSIATTCQLILKGYVSLGLCFDLVV